MTVNNFETVPYPKFPIANVTPFTYRDGHTYLELVEAMRAHINDSVVPTLQGNVDAFILALDDMHTAFLADLGEYRDQVIASQTEYTKLFNQYMDEFTTSVGNVNGVYDQVVALRDEVGVISGLTGEDEAVALLVGDTNTATSAAVVATVTKLSPTPQTDYEMTGNISTVDQEMEFWTRLADRSDRVRFGSAGVSVLGRPIPLITIGAPLPPAAPENVAASSLLVVATQQGGEPSPREAVMQFARDMAFSQDETITAYLRNHPIYLMPTANPDGEAAGTYENANGVNVNRDHLALAQPEGRAIHDVIRKVRPSLILDLHEAGVLPADFQVVAGRYGGTHPAINQVISEIYVATTRAVAATGFTVGEYTGSSQEPRTLHISAAMSLCPTLALESAAPAGRPIADRIANHATALRAIVEYHGAHSERVSAAVEELNAGPPATAYLQYSNVLDPAPTGYRLTAAELAAVQSTLNGHGLQVTPDGAGYLITLDQPAGRLVPQLLDSTAPYPIGVAARVFSPIPDYVVPDARVPHPPQGRIYTKVFGEDVLGAAPTGITEPLATGAVTIVAATGAHNGRGAEFSADTAAAAMVITEALADPLTADSEILFRWRSHTGLGQHGLLAFARMSGVLGLHSGYRGGYRHVASPTPATGAAQLVEYTSGAATILTPNVRIPAYEASTWYVSRFRVQGDMLAVSIWKDGDTEPIFDQNWTLDDTYVNGWAGVGRDGAIGSTVIDWMVHATGGLRAVAPVFA